MTYKKGFPIPGDCLTYCFIKNIEVIAKGERGIATSIPWDFSKPEGFEKW